jgi:hypothetical protein
MPLKYRTSNSDFCDSQRVICFTEAPLARLDVARREDGATYQVEGPSATSEGERGQHLVEAAGEGRELEPEPNRLLLSSNDANGTRCTLALPACSTPG